MIEQLNESAKKPGRVVVIGANGFVGSSIVKQLTEKNIKTLSIGRLEVDLLRDDSAEKLSNILKENDVVVIAAAKAPAKDFSMLLDNLRMLRPIIFSANQVSLSHLIYISSDAVYSDIRYKIKENSATKPSSIHGKMHLQRENILKSYFKNSLCIIRPTLVYGPGDTHCGYGPNRFVNFTLKNKKVVLFGNGEEKRDHIYINDLTLIIYRCILLKAVGTINAVSGKVHSFEKIAKLTNKILRKNNLILRLPRSGPMPHNGFRPFDNSLLKKYFKGIKITKINEGIKKYISLIK